MTLIEIMIALTIFAFIGIAVYSATTQTFRLKRIVQREADFFGAIRIAMTILDRDILGLFSPVGFIAPTPLSLQNNSRNGNGRQNGNISGAPPTENTRPLPNALTQNTDYWLGAIEPMGIRYSRFYGEPEVMRFVTNLHERVYQGSPESTFARVSYELKADPKSKTTSYRLIRTESANAFDDVDKKELFLKVNEIADGISKLKFRYYSARKKNWENRWDTQSDGERYEYPELIECEVTFTSPEKSTFQGKFVFQPGYPFRGLGRTF